MLKKKIRSKTAKKIKRVALFALGGHIANQNASFKKLIQLLEPKGYEFYGAEDGFKAFETGKVYPLTVKDIPEKFAGFVGGAGRYSLSKEEIRKIGKVSLNKAENFFRKGKFDIAVISGGDDHGKQAEILRKSLEGKLEVYVFNKTMDNDLGGIDGNVGPYTDLTNGYHTAVKRAVDMVHHHFSGAWTNNLPYLIGIFGREANWVASALSYWGLADKVIYGELPDSHPGHSVEKIHELILESQDKNEKKYGRRFAMLIVPEGTRITGIDHNSDLIDVHGHHKSQPEILVSHLKTDIEKKYNLKTQSLGITYEMRNFPPTQKDIWLGEESSIEISKAILRGDNGMESVFKINNGNIETGVAPISKVSEKRYTCYYPKHLIDYRSFEATQEIGEYYKPLFGERKRLSDFLPEKPRVINVFS